MSAVVSSVDDHRNYMLVKMHISNLLVPLFAASVLLSGCASTPTTQKQAPQSQTRQTDTAANEAVLALKEPQGKPTSVRLSPESVAIQNKENLDELNQQIEIASAKAQMMERTRIKRVGYLLGPGDAIEISVFLVEQLNKTVRVTGDGYILLPLLGAIDVEGKTVQQVQALLTQELGDKYLQSPQVTVFVTEYRSHQVAVLGAVEEPDIYNIKQPRSVLEMVSMAGGLTDAAGNRIRVQRSVIDAETGELTEELLIIDLRPLIEGLNNEASLLLSGGDSIMVPEAGTVFLEGHVHKPGGYPIKGGTTVLKALSMAGGTTFTAKKEDIQVFRRRTDGEMDNFEVNLNEIRENPQLDIELIDGDIVVIGVSKTKRGLAMFWDGLTSIFRVGATY